jgi:hypothetical protein
MPLKSDLVIDRSKFEDAAISEQTRQYNDALMRVTEGAPKWWDV